MPISAEIAVMFSPASAWRRLVKKDGGHWLARPAFLVLAVACAVSLMTAGRLTLRLILPVMAYATFIPALEFLSLAVVARGAMPLRRTAAVFFAGHGPWLLWLLGWSACWGLIPASVMYGHVYGGRVWMMATFAWSAYLDYQFFRAALGKGMFASLGSLAIQRVICWVPGMALFVAPAGWQVLVSSVGL